jgi:hypothetical protein
VALRPTIPLTGARGRRDSDPGEVPAPNTNPPPAPPKPPTEGASRALPVRNEPNFETKPYQAVVFDELTREMAEAHGASDDKANRQARIEWISLRSHWAADSQLMLLEDFIEAKGLFAEFVRVAKRKKR